MTHELRVLHFTMSHGGGVAKALVNVSQTGPGIEHHLLWDGPEPPHEDLFASSTQTGKGSARAARALSQAVSRLQPDIIHAHSSVAGAVARVRRWRMPVIYQPHCFKFDDPTTSRPLRWAVKSAERLLSARSSCIVAVSPHEQQLARSLGDSLTALVPNSSLLPAATAPRVSAGPLQSPRIVMIGRVCPQKDPHFFVRVADHVRRTLPGATFRWLGDGPADAVQPLTLAGVSVSGWLTSNALQSELSEADLYLHSAAYEGFPLSLLDAAQRRVPIVARRIPAFDQLGLVGGADVPDLAEQVIRLASSERERLGAVRLGDALVSRMNRDRQQQELSRIYHALLKDEFQYV